MWITTQVPLLQALPDPIGVENIVCDTMVMCRPSGVFIHMASNHKYYT